MHFTFTFDTCNKHNTNQHKHMTSRRMTVEELQIHAGSVHQNHHSQNGKGIYATMVSRPLDERTMPEAVSITKVHHSDGTFTVFPALSSM
jgi:hypothetical protein